MLAKFERSESDLWDSVMEGENQVLQPVLQMSHEGHSMQAQEYTRTRAHTHAHTHTEGGETN